MTTISSLGVGTTAVSEHAPSAYERTCYYNGINGEGIRGPKLIYRSNYRTTPFVMPTGRWAYPPVKSVYGVFDTPLNKIWNSIRDEVRAIVKAAVPDYSSIDVAQFYTHGPDGFVHNPDGVKDGGSMGPVTIWVSAPGSTSADIAHDASQQILALLSENDISDVVVEWREAYIVRRL